MKNLIVMDMDGTLLKEDKTISSNTKEALIKAQKQNNLLVLASGRVKKRMMSFAKEIKMDYYGGYFIEANGSVLYDLKNNKRTILRSMTYEEADELVTYLRNKYPTHEIMIMGDSNAFINLPINVQESIFFNTNNMESLRNRKIIKFNSVYEIDELFYKVCIYKDSNSVLDIMEDLKLNYSNKYWVGRTMPIWLEITPIDISKGNALKSLINDLNVDYNHVYIFGDGENDISMMKYGHSIAMKNALSTLKDKCEYVTLSNEEDGIKAYLDKFILED